jgi:hypothetical protein
LYECLSGIRPIQGNNLAHLVLKLVNPGVVPLSELSAQVPAEVCALTMRMLSRSPEARPTVAEVLEVLERYRAAVPADCAKDGATESYAAPWRSKNPPPVTPVPNRLRSSCATTAALPVVKRRWWRPVLAAACAVVVVGLLTSWPKEQPPRARVTSVP